MSTAFRNVDVDPGSPPSTWHHEAIVTVLERGSIRDWALLTADIGADPWGPVARQIEEYLSYERPPGLAPLLRRRIARARERAEADERRSVATRVCALVASSGLTMSEFAGRIGTSRTRLSTYRSGRVTPSAALLLRMERLAERLSPPA